MAAEYHPTMAELMERNKQYAAGHQPIPSLMTRMKNNPKANGPHVLIISCFDSRANPFNFLNLGPRECLVLRNVGGRFASTASEIAALDTLFHVSQIILVHHSNCGTSHITLEQGLVAVREKRLEFTNFGELKARLPMKEDNYNPLIADLQKVRSNGFLRKDLIASVTGFWLDVETGLLTRVYADGQTGKI